MEAGTIKPNKALLAIWAGLKDSKAARQDFEAPGDNLRDILNAWAQLDPQQREQARQMLEGRA